MRVELKTETAFNTSDNRLYERRLARLQRRLGREAGDHAILTIQLETEPRTGRCVGAGRLTIGHEVLIAHRNAADAAGSLLKQMFDDLERQLGARSARRRAMRRAVAARP